MATINKRVIGLAENERNRKVLHPNPQFGIHNIPYDRYKDKSIFQMEDNTPSINRRIGMSQDTRLIARPCESVNDRMAVRTGSGFRVNHYEVRAGDGLTPRFFTPDRLHFTSNLQQKPLINKIY